MNWFEEWFDSPYYHILYKNRDFKEAELFIDNLTQYLNLPQNSSIIDIPCGKGRHSIYLNKKGYRVTGADLSPESILYAKRFSNPSLEFFIQDMREEFAENSYDCLLNIFTSFGYFDHSDENQQCINSFAKALKSNGKLVIDFINIHKATTHLQSEEIKIIENITFIITKKIEGNFLIKDIRFNDKGKTYHFQEKVHLLYKDDFLKYFNFANLKLVTLFGDYQLNNFDLANSDRLILIAEK